MAGLEANLFCLIGALDQAGSKTGPLLRPNLRSSVLAAAALCPGARAQGEQYTAVFLSLSVYLHEQKVSSPPPPPHKQLHLPLYSHTFTLLPFQMTACAKRRELFI
jgi:hypothetical protein